MPMRDPSTVDLPDDLDPGRRKLPSSVKSLSLNESSIDVLIRGPKRVDLPDDLDPGRRELLSSIRSVTLNDCAKDSSLDISSREPREPKEGLLPPCDLVGLV
mmetsp:Transcript_36177/g.87523  ORF Transcript_36177/g.87523 Transcript_36177/m.87523 type:complete len:102 (+) Transcript_36177:3403-3708(+)